MKPLIINYLLTQGYQIWPTFGEYKYRAFWWLHETVWHWFILRVVYMAEVWSYPKLLHDVSKHLRSRCTIKLLFVCHLFSVPIFSGFCYEYCYWGPERNSIFQPGSPTNSITSVFSRLVVVVVGGFPLNVPGKKKTDHNICSEDTLHLKTGGSTLKEERNILWGYNPQTPLLLVTFMSSTEDHIQELWLSA